VAPRIDFVRRTPKVYLAGRVSKNDWRHNLVPGLRGAVQSYEMSAVPFPDDMATEDGFSYQGPFFVSDDHGCAHGPGSHGNGANGCMEQAELQDAHRTLVAERCVEGIRRSDHVFVWLDDFAAFGTLVEVGVAVALGKKVWIYASEDLAISELWFALHVAGEGRVMRFTDATSAARDFFEKVSIKAVPL
jgi:hypothetical protein